MTSQVRADAPYAAAQLGEAVPLLPLRQNLPAGLPSQSSRQDTHRGETFRVSDTLGSFFRQSLLTVQSWALAVIFGF